LLQSQTPAEPHLEIVSKRRHRLPRKT
jgi:hypothetical protein